MRCSSDAWSRHGATSHSRRHPQGCLDAGRRSRERRHLRVGLRDAGLVRADPGRLPGRNRGRRGRRSSGSPRRRSGPVGSATCQGMGTARRQTAGWTRAAPCLNRCPIPRTPTTTSWSTRQSSTSTRWTATGSPVKTASQRCTREVIRSSTGPDGTERKPMRNAEARITLGVVAARAGDLDQAVSHGRQALEGIANHCHPC